jgi:hypothetical protein
VSAAGTAAAATFKANNTTSLPHSKELIVIHLPAHELLFADTTSLLPGLVLGL